MRPDKFKIKKLAITAIAAALLQLPNVSHATGMVAGATEFTQIFNNIELATIVSEEVAQYGQMLSDYAVQVNQYNTLIRNLTTLPQKVLNEITKPFDREIKAFNKVYRAVQATDTVLSTQQKMLEDLDKLYETKNLTPEQMILASYQNSVNRRDDYAAQVKAQTQLMSEVETRAGDMKAVAESIGSIEGTRDGLQTNAQMLSILGNELNAMNRTLTSMHKFQLNEQGLQPSIEAARAKEEAQRLLAIKKAKDAAYLEDAKKARMPILGRKKVEEKEPDPEKDIPLL